MTKAIFEDWYMNYFRPEVTEFCATKNIAFQAVLLLDNVAGHPNNLNNLQSEVLVIHIPPRTTSMMQPMDQEVMVTFKLLYMDLTFESINTVLDNDAELQVQAF